MLTYLNYDLSVNPLEYERISSMLLGDDVGQKDSLLSVWFPPQTSEDQLLGSTHSSGSQESSFSCQPALARA